MTSDLCFLQVLQTVFAISSVRRHKLQIFGSIGFSRAERVSYLIAISYLNITWLWLYTYHQTLDFIYASKIINWLKASNHWSLVWGLRWLTGEPPCSLLIAHCSLLIAHCSMVYAMLACNSQMQYARSLCICLQLYSRFTNCFAGKAAMLLF